MACFTTDLFLGAVQNVKASSVFFSRSILNFHPRNLQSDHKNKKRGEEEEQIAGLQKARMVADLSSDVAHIAQLNDNSVELCFSHNVNWESGCKELRLSRVYDSATKDTIDYNKSDHRL